MTGSAGAALGFAGAGVFLVFAVIQLNDPDPLRWFAAYAAVALASGMAGLRRLPWGIALAGAAACFALAGLLVGSWDGQSAPMGPTSQGIFAEEVVREAGGLSIAGAWLLVLALLARRDATKTLAG